jgi:hypothetical protein
MENYGELYASVTLNLEEILYVNITLLGPGTGLIILQKKISLASAGNRTRIQ